ncbi:MAG: hypothetical protein IJN54_07675 [Lachnospiraceae bacterium]|nr:hypothetical protein [Lachnospiraceae bacterium]
MVAVWVDVQKRAGEFKDVADADIMKYFMERFGVSTNYIVIFAFVCARRIPMEQL